jgi:hypothetical protein
MEFLINMPSPNGCFIIIHIRLFYSAGILTIITLLALDLQFYYRYAAVTKNIDGKYQVSFLPYPAGL